MFGRIFSKCTQRDMCNLLFQSAQIWQPWMRFQGSSPVFSTPDICSFGYFNNQSCSWEIRAWKGKRIVFTQRHEFFLVVRWSIVGMVWYIRTPIKIFLNIHFEFAYYGFINLACASSETHNLQRIFLHIQDSKGGHCAREWESLRDRSHACFCEERLSKIKFRAFRRRVGPRIL